jgi:hypothetical protein
MATIYATGANTNGEFGLGDSVAHYTYAQIPGTWLKIKIGQGFAVGIMADGTLWGVGDNSSKQLGLPNASYSAWTQIGIDTDWADVAVGNGFTIALKTNGNIYACGLNNHGQCAQNNTTSPITTLTQIAFVHSFSKLYCDDSAVRAFALDTSNVLYGWGFNGTNGLLGLGTTTTHYLTPQAITLPAVVSDLSLSLSHTMAVLANGTLYGWGGNTYGQQGDGSSTTSTSPRQVGTDTNWSKVAASSFNSYALKTTGTVWAAGDGGSYQLGQGNTASSATLIQIGTDTDWSAVHAPETAVILQKINGSIYVCGNTPVSFGNGNISSLTVQNLETTWSITLPAGIKTLEVSNDTAQLVYSVIAEAVSAPITVTVSNPSGSISAPIAVSVADTGSISAPVSINVLNTLETTTWTAQVMLGGVDVSANLTGTISWDAEEGASRVADFTLRPAAGSVSPTTWTGQEVSIDVVRLVGALSMHTRVFTGVVDVATFDPVKRTVGFTCTSDLQNRVAALPVASIDALCGGTYSEAVSGAIGERWAYAQARMSSRTASLDSGPMSGPRVTEWNGLAVWRTFTEADVLDASPSIDLPKRNQIVNQVDIAFEYRYYRCRQRQASIGWSKSAYTAEAWQSSYQYPSQDEIESALAGSGWKVLYQSFGSPPAHIAVASPSGYYVVTSGVANFTASLAQRHAQAVTESYALTVTAPTSIAANGALAKPLRGALQSDWTPNQWEADFTVTVPLNAPGEIDYAGTMTRAVSDAAIQNLLDMAKSMIYASHRKAAVTFSVPCLPEADLTMAATLNTAALQASGKISRVQGKLDIDAGSAISTITLALSGIAAGGILTPDALTPPAQPALDVGTDSWSTDLPNLLTHIGNVTNYVYDYTQMGFLVGATASYSVTNGTDSTSVANPAYNAAAGYAQKVNGFRVQMPGVAENFRNPATVNHAQAYQLDLPTDTLTMTV